MQFKCKHTILYDFVNSKIFRKVNLLYNIDFQNFFFKCLEKCTSKDFEVSTFNDKKNSILDELCLYFSEKYPDYFTKKGKKRFYKLINEFLNCFTYKLPKFLDIDISNYPFNQFDIIEGEKDNEFVKPPKKNTFKIKEEEEENEEEIFSQIDADTDSEIFRLISKKYKETKSEIINVYPCLINKAETICLKNLLRITKLHFAPDNINNNIITTLANFKIECWEMADKIAGDNKFLQKSS